MAEAHALFFLLVLAARFISRPAASASCMGRWGQCGFNIYVQTGNINNAGTDATVSLAISSGGGGGNQLTIPNLQNQGTMGANHDYFEKGNLDSFSVTSECLPGPPCWMLLSQDDTNDNPGWYVDFVQVFTSTGAMHQFNVYQWLARDEPPYQLTTVRNDCGQVQRLIGGGGGGGMVLVRTSSVPATSPKLPTAAAAAEATTTHQIHDDDAAAARESTAGSSSSSS